MRRLIIFLVRRKLGIKKYRYFRFKNQKSTAIYFFTKDKLVKMWRRDTEDAGVSLNWLLNDECEIDILPLQGNIKWI